MARFWIISGVVGALIALVTQLPLAWVVGAFIPTPPTQNLHVSGTVWRGIIHDTGGLGRIHIRTHIEALITGKAPVHFTTHQSPIALEGRADFGGIKGLSIKGSITDVPVPDYRLRDIKGDFGLTLERVKFSDICEAATGRFETNVLMRNQAIWQWTGPNLSGPVRCEAGALTFILSGEDSGFRADIDFRLWVSGEYRFSADINTRRTDIETVLMISGFEKTPTGYRLSETGRWR